MKQFLFTALALVAFATSKAQNVSLNVILKPIQTLTIKEEQKVVNLEYATTGDYQNGVSKTNDDHLTIYSTGGFQVKVKATDANMTLNGKNMAVTTIKLSSSAGSQALTNATYQQDLSLSSSEATLVSSSNGAVNKSVNVKYQGAGANAYIDNYVPNQNPSIYKATLVYTIVSA
ncbi:hypothetical protein [Chryseobacterium luquanense]|uniref:DUF4402 domain-containing protein n=1 Tax=Chryseobacterium luquanense TaxID=2983766 RepID=A0ABT3Y7F3_9FLAO|nr:hypothetical protein [Chryseobacterium luquanense]MCX8534086.1 hypothetical protein [Chryseobacterium luquanense]